MQVKHANEVLTKDGHEKDRIIKKLQRTVEKQEKTIIEIERELQEVNQFYNS